MGFIVGIDGTAGSGKGTVTKKISNKLGLINIDTGSTYRCVALESINQGVTLEDKEKIIEIAKTIKCASADKKVIDKHLSVWYHTIVLTAEDSRCRKA